VRSASQVVLTLADLKACSAEDSKADVGTIHTTMRALSDKMRWSSVAVMHGCGKGMLASDLPAGNRLSHRRFSMRRIGLVDLVLIGSRSRTDAEPALCARSGRA
jgi:hypothetical protein